MPRSKSKNKVVALTHKKGRVAERAVKRYLEGNGFSKVELCKTIRGPDITCRLNDVDMRVEVKCAVRYVRHAKYEFWLTEKVTPGRMQDELIAIVSPCGRILLQEMGEHLFLCRKDGRRNVTEFVKQKVVA